MRTSAALNDRKSSLKVVESLFRLAEPPRGPGGGFLPRSEAGRWDAERLGAFGLIHDLVIETADPIVILEVARRLSWYIEYDPESFFGSTALTILTSIPKSLAIELLAVLSGTFDLWSVPGGWHDAEEWEEQRRYQQEVVSAITQSLQELHPHIHDLADAIDDGLQQLIEAGVRPVPNQVLIEIAEQSTGQARSFIEHCLGHPDQALTSYLALFLSVFRQFDRREAALLCMGAIDSGELSLQWAVAGWARVCATDPTLIDIVAIEQLLASSDLRVRHSALESLSALARTHGRIAIDLALPVEVAGDSAMASALCAVFHPSLGVAMDQVADDEIRRVLAKISVTVALNGYHLQEFLRVAAGRFLLDVVKMLLRRVTYSNSESSSEFHALPYGDLDAVFRGTGSHPQHGAALREIRATSLSMGWSAERWLPELFASASDGLSAESIAVLTEWAVSGEADKMKAVARLIKDAPPSFVFDQSAFVILLIHRAQHLTVEEFRYISSLLIMSAHARTRSRTPGVQGEYPEDVILRDRSATMLTLLTPGSPEHLFYADLKRDAERSIEHERRRDEEDFG